VSKRRITIAAWLLAGHAILGGLYWLLLQIPESNTLMLTTSVLVVVAGLAWLGYVETVGLSGFCTHDTVRSALASGLRRSVWIVPSLVVFVAVWLLASFAGNWWTAHATEVDAWLILRFGWTDAQPLHTTMAWLLWFVRYGVGLSMAVALLAAAVCRGAAGVLEPRWLAQAFHWKTLLITATAVWFGIWLPWHYIEWRPESLPLTWVQPAFAAAKLFVSVTVMHLAWATVLWWAARHAVPGPVAAATPQAAAPLVSADGVDARIPMSEPTQPETPGQSADPDHSGTGR
jgi:hypothetical protein